MINIQKVVETIGDRGTYKKILIAFLICSFIELELMLGSTFVFINPIFDCPGLDNSSEDDACPIIDTYTLSM